MFADDNVIPLVYYIIASIVDISGVLFNIFTLIFISFTSLGSKSSTILFRTQCGFDGLACFFAIITLFTSVNISDYNGWLAEFLCHIWVSEYWIKLMELLNVSNLMWISIDRFCAVYLQIKYKVFQKYELFICYTFILCHAVFTPIPFIFTVKHENDTCNTVELIYNPQFQNFLVYSWLVFAYIIPSVVMITCYSRVYCIIKQSIVQTQAQKSSSFTVEGSTQYGNTSTFSQHKISTNMPVSKPSSSLRQVQSVLLSITMMCTLFVLSHSYYQIYTLLSLTGAIQYKTISLQRRLSVFFTVINSSLNPIILLLSSQKLRRRLFKFFRKIFIKMNFSTNNNTTISTIDSTTKTSGD
ncbi:unnamed protein product [Schistosoma margrebowiei]|uniref:G_PROTEIN_RECEP_F1_2 domain-containing protein n=1 Tax=Schistosoma margrebowiei TaxID=48269 RepID=A0AA84ZM33_9TREM|nr:unnamed protein product [Schistosoma margrebowiei]